MKQTAQEMKEKLAKDPSVTFWLKDQVEKMEQRDVLDAYYDAKLLFQYCQLRWFEVSGKNRSPEDNIEQARRDA